jgi:hypothetical protein
MSDKVHRKLRLDVVETRQACNVSFLHEKTVHKIDRGEPVRTVTLYRFKAALQVLGWEHRFPELFQSPLGGAADADPTVVLEPEDAEEEAPAVAS